MIDIIPGVLPVRSTDIPNTMETHNDCSKNHIVSNISKLVQQ